MSDTVLTNLKRYFVDNYTCVRGDTFAPLPDTIRINGVLEDYSGKTIKMHVRKNGTLIHEMNLGDGISNPSAGVLQYYIPAATMINWVAGVYKYDVQVTDGSGTITTIKKGIIDFEDDETV